MKLTNGCKVVVTQDLYVIDTDSVANKYEIYTTNEVKELCPLYIEKGTILTYEEEDDIFCNNEIDTMLSPEHYKIIDEQQIAQLLLDYLTEEQLLTITSALEMSAESWSGHKDYDNNEEAQQHYKMAEFCNLITEKINNQINK